MNQRPSPRVVAPEDRRRIDRGRGHRDEGEVPAFDLVEEPVGGVLEADESAEEFDPLGAGQGVCFRPHEGGDNPQAQVPGPLQRRHVVRRVHREERDLRRSREEHLHVRGQVPRISELPEPPILDLRPYGVVVGAPASDRDQAVCRTQLGDQSKQVVGIHRQGMDWHLDDMGPIQLGGQLRVLAFTGHEYHHILDKLDIVTPGLKGGDFSEGANDRVVSSPVEREVFRVSHQVRRRRRIHRVSTDVTSWTGLLRGRPTSRRQDREGEQEDRTSHEGLLCPEVNSAGFLAAAGRLPGSVIRCALTRRSQVGRLKASPQLLRQVI